jgi:hypothetical protein
MDRGSQSVCRMATSAMPLSPAGLTHAGSSWASFRLLSCCLLSGRLHVPGLQHLIAAGLEYWSLPS